MEFLNHEVMEDTGINSINLLMAS